MKYTETKNPAIFKVIANPSLIKTKKGENISRNYWQRDINDWICICGVCDQRR